MVRVGTTTVVTLAAALAHNYNSFARCFILS